MRPRRALGGHHPTTLLITTRKNSTNRGRREHCQQCTARWLLVQIFAPVAQGWGRSQAAPVLESVQTPRKVGSGSNRSQILTSANCVCDRGRMTDGKGACGGCLSQRSTASTHDLRWENEVEHASTGPHLRRPGTAVAGCEEHRCVREQDFLPQPSSEAPGTMAAVGLGGSRPRELLGTRRARVPRTAGPALSGGLADEDHGSRPTGHQVAAERHAGAPLPDRARPPPDAVVFVVDVECAGDPDPPEPVEYLADRGAGVGHPPPLLCRRLPGRNRRPRAHGSRAVTASIQSR